MKSKAISFSLFGYGKAAPENCFPFDSYIRGLMINIRIARIIYPEWICVVNTDVETYESKYKPIFDWLEKNGLIELNFHPNAPLCLAMLWRLFPVFETNAKGLWKYTHVICRDTDSVVTYREAQAVQQWVNEDKAFHGITDSISHNIPAMGGMIGLRPAYASERLHAQTWQQLIDQSQGINFNRKGSDQDFLGKYVYPRLADSATEHHVLGMVRNLPEGNGRHYSITDIDIFVNPFYKVTNDLAGHVGAAGYYESPTVKFLTSQDEFRNEYAEIENQFPQLFFWRS